MSKFNQKSPTTKTVNVAGGKAYKMTDKNELVFAVLNTFLENKFYESGSARLDRIVELTRRIAANEPEFVAKLAIYARTQANMRSVFPVLVGELSKVHKGDSLVSRTIISGAERADDLTELVSYLGKPLPKQVKVALQKMLPQLTEYELAKYAQKDKKVKLVDLFNLAHPKTVGEYFKSFIDGELRNVDTWEAMRSARKDWKEIIETGKVGYMALLRNLRNIEETKDDELISKVASIIENEDKVKKSKQLPFRFASAYKNISNRKLLGAVENALEISLSNVPKLHGKVLIALDKSGSMNGDPMEKAGLFAAMLYKTNKNADFIFYDAAVRELKSSGNESVLSMVSKFPTDGGGTQTSLVFNYAMEKSIKYDTVVVLSDNASWQEGYYGTSVQAHYEAYKTAFSPEVKVWAIDVAGYGTTDLTGDVKHVSGWSDKVFDLMVLLDSGKSLVDVINEVEI